MTNDIHKGARRFDHTEHESLDTEDLDIGGEDLASSGDFIGQFTLSNYQETFQTTATSYTGDEAYALWYFDESLWPDDVDLAWSYIFRAVPGSGETMGVRLQNIGMDTTILEQTGIDSAQTYRLGPVTYRPTSSVPNRIQPEIKTDVGSNASLIRRSVVYGGVQL